MEDSARLWEVLQRVRSLQFVARSESATGWNGSGSGEVIVESPTSDILIFKESGSWQPPSGQNIRFRNVFRWSLLGPQTVRLEHLRFGAEHPVYLFDLAPSAESAWASVSPHLCSEDCYSAELKLKENGLSLRWTVTGPKMQETIAYDYQ